MSSTRGKNAVLVAASIAACAYVLLHRARSWWEGEGRWSDGGAELRALEDRGLRHAVWDAARALPGGVNTPQNETHPALSPDGRWLVFSVGERNQDAGLFVAEIVGGEPLEPRRIASVDSTDDELAPAFSAAFLYFASERAGGAGGLDLWRAPFFEGACGPPERLPEAVQSAEDDTDPSPSTDDQELVFASNRGGDFDLYNTPLGSEVPSVARIEALRTPGAERDPCLDPCDHPADGSGDGSGADERRPTHGRALTFASDRGGDFDLYRSARGQNGWAAPVVLEGLNTPAAERGPALSPDGFGLTFERSMADGTADLLHARSREVFSIAGRPWTWFDTAVVASLLLLALMALLARRWPALDLLYKCLLVSVLLHLLLLYLFQYFFVGTGAMPEREGVRYRVRLEASAEAPSALTERAGRIAPRTDVEVGGPERALTIEPLESAQSAPAGQAPLVLLATGPEATAPERGRDARLPEASGSAPSVALRAPDAVAAARADVTPAMGLPPARAESAPTSASAPERARLASAPGTEPASPARELVVVGPIETPMVEPERADSVRLSSTDSNVPSVALVSPAERALSLRAERAPGFELPLRVPSGLSDTGTPERAAPDAGRADTHATPGSTEALVATPTGAHARAPVRTTADRPLEGGPSRADVVLRAPEKATGRVRTGSAPELALEVRSAPHAGGTSAAPKPERADRSPSPAESRATAAAPMAPLVSTGGIGGTGGAEAQVTAPARADSGRARAPVPGVALAVPVAVPGASEAERAAPGAHSTPAPALQLGDARAVPAPVRGTSAERASIAAEDARVRDGAPAPGPLALHAPTPASGAPSAPARAAAAEPPGSPAGGGGAAPRVDLADRAEPVARRPSGGSGQEDLLVDMSASTARPRALAGGGPELARVDRAPPARNPEPAPASAPLARAPELDRAPPPLERQPWDATPYANRSPEQKAQALELHGGDVATEQAVEKGLAYLARIQGRAGNWGRSDDRDPKYGELAIGKTGLALLAFLGAGHTHRSETRYSANVRRALDYLCSRQDAATGHFGEGEAYSHGIAAYALAECVAMTGDGDLKQALVKAIERILAAQDRNADPRLFGGWSYYYADGHAYDRWPRTSIVVWQIMALESARLSGIVVDDAVFEATRAFLIQARDDEQGAWRYNHDPERLSDRYSTLPASTPAGMFAMSLMGADLASAEYGELRRFVLQRRPNGYRYAGDDEFVFRGTGNLYFWYYGTLAMFRAGGASWQVWNEGMKSTLVPAQAADGSWEPIDPYARYARDRADDRSYTTAMCVLSLEIYYRYYLPLLKVK